MQSLANTHAAEGAGAWRERIAAVVIGCAVTCALTFPTIRDLGTAGRFDTGDGRFSIWNVAWVAHALVDDPRRLFDANIFYPHPDTLTYSELNLVAGALAAPMYAATRNPIAAHNSAILLSLLASFLAMWGLVRRLTGSPGAAIVSAVGYTFSAYTAAHTAEIQLLMIFGFPLVMLTFHAMRDRPTLAAGAGLGVALAATALASGYYGVFAEGLVGLSTLIWARRERAYWAALAAAGVVAAALVLPVLIPYLRDRAAAGPLRTTGATELQTYSATLRDYVTSGTTVGETSLRWAAKVKQALLPHLAVPMWTEVQSPGVVIGFLALIGLTRIGRDRHETRMILGYGLIGAMALWGSFGPRAGLYRVLEKILPGISMLRAPARLGTIVTFALAVLAGFGYRHLRRSRRWLMFVCLPVLLAELWVPWPLQRMPRPERAYQILATLPRAGVIEFPFHYMSGDFHEHTRAMVRSMANWQPLVNGYSDFTPPDFYDLAMPVNSFPDAMSFEVLRSYGVRYVILRLAEYGTYRDVMLSRFPAYERYMRRLTDEHDVWLLEIVSWPE